MSAFFACRSYARRSKASAPKARIVRSNSHAELKAAHGLDNEEDLIMPKLVLLHAMLNRLGASRVRNILTMGNCEGVLLCDELWS